MLISAFWGVFVGKKSEHKGAGGEGVSTTGCETVNGSGKNCRSMVKSSDVWGGAGYGGCWCVSITRIQ